MKIYHQRLEHLCLVDQLIVITILFGNKYYATGNPVNFALYGAKFLGKVEQLS